MTGQLQKFGRLVESARRESPPEIDVTAAVVDRLSNGIPDATAEKYGTRLGRNIVRSSLVASVCVAAVWIGWFARTESNHALAAVQHARQTLSRPTDRTYAITVEGRAPQGSTHGRHATFFARGTDHFVFKITGPFGIDILAGSDGIESWLIPPVGPVLVGSDSFLIDRWLSQERIPIPLLSLDETLQRLETRYDLSVIDAANDQLGDHDQSPTLADSIHVIGHRHSDKSMIPGTVELWSHRKSGVLQRLELRWDGTATRLGPRTITVVLKSEEQLAADFFTHTPHHPPGKPVRKLDSDEMPASSE